MLTCMPNIFGPKALWLTAFITVRYGALVELRAFYGLMNPLLSSVAVDFPITVSLLRDALSTPINTMAPLTARLCGRWTVNRKLSQAIPTSLECIAILFCLKEPFLVAKRTDFYMKVRAGTFVSAVQIGIAEWKNIMSICLAKVAAWKIQTVFRIIVKQSA